jgi:hypothetical protein
MPFMVTVPGRPARRRVRVVRMKVRKPVEVSDTSSVTESYGGGESPAVGRVVYVGGIDREDPEAVPAALKGLVEAARYACRAVAANGLYEPKDTVAALEDTVAALVQLSTSIGPYVGDYSKQGERVLGRSGQRLAEARADLGKARHHIVLDPLLVPEGL